MYKQKFLMKFLLICLIVLYTCVSVAADVPVWHKWSEEDKPFGVRIRRVRNHIMEAESTRIEGTLGRKMNQRVKISVGLGINFLHAADKISEFGLDLSPLPVGTFSIYSITPLKTTGLEVYSSGSIGAAGSKVIVKETNESVGSITNVGLEVKWGLLKRIATVPGEWLTVLGGLSYSYEWLTLVDSEESITGSEGFLGWEIATALNLSSKFSVFAGVGSLFEKSNSFVFGGFQFY